MDEAGDLPGLAGKKRGGFPAKDAEDLLVACHRRCCICHKYCGVKAELDHIEPWSESHDDQISNAIVVCFDCHAEIHHYNEKHPKGRKFRPSEILKHKQQWLEICKNHPGEIAELGRNVEPSIIERLYHEIDLNRMIANANTSPKRFGCKFETASFSSAVDSGLFTWMEESVRKKLFNLYVGFRQANGMIDGYYAQQIHLRGQIVNEAMPLIKDIIADIPAALEAIQGERLGTSGTTPGK